MLLQGLVLNGQVLESTFYDQMTGQPKPGYSVRLTVLDSGPMRSTSVSSAMGFPPWINCELKKQGQPADVLQQVAQQLRAELPPKMTPIALHVRRIKGKGGFMTLVCRLAAAAAAVYVKGGKRGVLPRDARSKVWVRKSSIWCCAWCR